jgi:hypothetical protein
MTPALIQFTTDISEAQPRRTEGVVLESLITQITQLIDAARQQVTTMVNSSLALLYWQIERRIQTQVLLEKRTDYGKAIVATLSRLFIFLPTCTRQSSHFRRYLPSRKSQLGSDPFAPLLAFCYAHLAFGVRP